MMSVFTIGKGDFILTWLPELNFVVSVEWRERIDKNVLCRKDDLARNTKNLLREDER